MRDDFAVFILTHNRADVICTDKALARAGYTGKVIYVLDNEDPAIQAYKDKFGEENIYVFNKLEKAKHIDSMDLSTDRRAILYARNACYDIAKELGYKYFLQLDDDYSNFRGRRLLHNKFASIYVRDFDSIVDCMLEFLENSGAHTVAMSQIGDFIGGTGSKLYKDKISRKAMNAFFCKTDRPIEFKGRMNEDVTAYVGEGSVGKLFFTVRDVSIDQLATQSLSGGMSESYGASGTYIKSFYTVMCCPSCVKVYVVGTTHKRLHHIIDWDKAVPKIISSDFKKGE